MKKAIFVLVILFSFTSVFGQKNKKGISIVENDINKVKTSNTIYFYGWDLSHSKLTDGDMINRTEELPQKIGGILGLLSERFSQKKMKKYLKKDVTADLDIVQKNIKNIDFDNFVTFNSHNLNKDSIAQIVSNYNLPQKQGVGLVIVAENMNKSERYATAYITFFDLESKDLIWVTKMKGLPGSKWGFSKYWNKGYLECLHYFFVRYYK